MPLAQSLLVPPLRRKVYWPQRVWSWPPSLDQSVPDRPVVRQYAFRTGGFWQPQKSSLFPTPADQSIPDLPFIPQYGFRPGGFWQLKNRSPLYPAPADQSVPDRPPLTPYPFRPGGFWQPQKLWLFPAPADQPVGDRPPLTPYLFRTGGFWQTQKPVTVDLVVSIIVPPPGPLPPAPSLPISTSGALKQFLELQGLGIKVYRDQAPENAPKPYLTVDEAMAIIPDPLEDATATTISEHLTVHVWMSWKDLLARPNARLEDPTLADRVADVLHGSRLSVGFQNPPMLTYAVIVRNVGPRIVERDADVVHVPLWVQIWRVL